MTLENGLSLKDEVQRMRAEVATQGERVRKLKKDGAVKAAIDTEVSTLSDLKAKLQQKEKQLEESTPLYTRCREPLENLVKRRLFVIPGFEIYGGVAGLFDFGPPGCALKAEVEALWRRHFVLHEDMLEVSGTCLTPEVVLKTSGHVDRFTDLMVKDTVTGECYRADKILEEQIEAKQKAGLPPDEHDRLEKLKVQADALSSEEMHQAFLDLGIKSPDGNGFSTPFPFNLMFKTSIGPKGDLVGYLRPETAQGIFVNFRRLLEFNGGKMPFAAAQLGLGFRNEIAPRSGLLRVREFQMGEIEHFVHPDHKEHPKFGAVKDMKLPLFPRDRQLGDGKVVMDMTLEHAVQTKVINNETLAYFLARTYLFLTKCGIQHVGMRFRQHLETEMAHYACDCWDCEIETSYGWVECVGHADRSAYDLSHHTKASKVDLVAQHKFDAPRDIEYVKFTPNRPKLGQAFKQDQAAVIEALEEKPDQERLHIQQQLDASGTYELKLCTGQSFTITKEMAKFEKAVKRVAVEAYVPAVIEPSFGIGRIIYCILEHTFRSRGIQDQEERCFLSLPPVIAPIKCSVLPISANTQFDDLINQLKEQLTYHGVSSQVDSTSASIGRRYARTDELGIPFGITVDFQSVKDSTVTLRERDSMKQIRVPAIEIPELVHNMVAGRTTWDKARDKYPEFIAQEA
ncbi:unnamed protein product [Vitrella brassicaformis CCMP3155]|uniref:glycine--tRNA ligase n=1 Tax=Vitrella brassicaformis (strain CCMP3155) TaxID=1169540 RepID=A0A0G4ENF6_VITBC|nr:unnamed protein product [Vitrella brassicaformis CCMP3155]|eukprot:CEL98366.1 unnamed protein product [Vitrella brassicaformis CCMP3155]